MKNKGITLIEFIISLALISIVMLFLFNLLLDVQYTVKNGNFARDNQINRAHIIRAVQDDFNNLELVDLSEVSYVDRLEIKFVFANNISKTLKIYADKIEYDNERWSLDSSNSKVKYQINCIPFTYRAKCKNGICSNFSSIFFKVPVVIEGQEENTMDDLEFYYMGDLGKINSVIKNKVFWEIMEDV